MLHTNLTAARYDALGLAATKLADHKREFVRTRLHYGDSILRRFRDEGRDLDALAMECRYAAEGCEQSIAIIEDYLIEDEFHLASGVVA